MYKCKKCGAVLDEAGIGYDSHCYQVETYDGMGDVEYGDIIEFYCPECGGEIPSDTAIAVSEMWSEDRIKNNEEKK